MGGKEKGKDNKSFSFVCLPLQEWLQWFLMLHEEISNGLSAVSPLLSLVLLFHYPVPHWTCSHVASAQQWPHGAAAKCSVTSFLLLPSMLCLNGQRGRQEFGQTQSRRVAAGWWGLGSESNLNKTQAVLSLCQRQTENGSHNQGGQEMSWQTMGQLQVTALFRQLSQEELVFVLLVWLHVPEACLSFSLRVMTRWSSSNNNCAWYSWCSGQEKHNPEKACLVTEFFV